MAKKRAPRPPRILSTQQVEELFASLDETGHVNPVLGEQERARREAGQPAVAIDPLSGKDPSGSNVDKIIARTAMLFVCITLAVILLAQVSCGFARRANAGNLAEDVTLQTVTSSLQSGVEWGGGFTQFPEEFQVQEADEATGRIEVTVVDTQSTDELEVMAGSYIQATAFATNALLNPNINTVIYRVGVHQDEEGRIQKAAFYGFLQPTGPVRNFMTFIFTKATSSSGGFNIFCTITGLDAATTQTLREKIGGGPFDFLTEAAEGAQGAEGDKLQNAHANGGAAADASADATEGAAAATTESVSDGAGA